MSAVTARGCRTGRLWSCTGLGGPAAAKGSEKAARPGRGPAFPRPAGGAEPLEPREGAGPYPSPAGASATSPQVPCAPPLRPCCAPVPSDLRPAAARRHRPRTASGSSRSQPRTALGGTQPMRVRSVLPAGGRPRPPARDGWCRSAGRGRGRAGTRAPHWGGGDIVSSCPRLPGRRFFPARLACACPLPLRLPDLLPGEEAWLNRERNGAPAFCRRQLVLRDGALGAREKAALHCFVESGGE